MLDLPRISSNRVTELLIRWTEGNVGAREELIPLVYEELRRMARQCLAGQRRDHTLQSTALVHEAYLRLVHCRSVHWQNRAQFFALAAQLMRQILVDHARARSAKKRKGYGVTLRDRAKTSLQLRLDGVVPFGQSFMALQSK